MARFCSALEQLSHSVTPSVLLSLEAAIAQRDIAAAAASSVLVFNMHRRGSYGNRRHCLNPMTEDESRFWCFFFWGGLAPVGQ